MWNDCDLPVSADNKVYHLDISSKDITDRIIIVGDPGRVIFLAENFLEPGYFSHEHRGLRSVTGRVQRSGHSSHGQNVTFLTSGMGTGSLEIVLGELLALNSYNLNERHSMVKNTSSLRIIRVGTSGALQKTTTLGTIVISQFSLGLEIAANFYKKAAQSTICKNLEHRFQKELSFLPFAPYLSEASTELHNAAVRKATLHQLNFCSGITVSNSGFFAPQGRSFPPEQAQYPELETTLAEINTGLPDVKLENMEMESSFLMYFSALQNWQALTIAPVIAHRPTGTFLENSNAVILSSAALALDTLFYDL